MKLTADNAKTAARLHNRKKYRKDVIRQYRAIKSSVKWHAKRGKRSLSIRSRIWDFEEFHAVRLFTYKHQDFDVYWEYDGMPSDGRVDLDKHDTFSITIKW